MNTIKNILFFFSLFFLLGSSINVSSEEWVNREVQILTMQASNIDPTVLKLGLRAYQKARSFGLDAKELLTIIDYDKLSTDRRLFVIDMKHEKILFNTWVSHGKNSGELKATSFSNEPGSLKSSLGLLLTDIEPYVGENGYSLRLIGLEPGINDNAYNRDIVVHGAWYSDPSIIGRYGELGRSWGCPSVSDRLAQPLIDTIKGNTLVFVYSRNRFWLSRSNFLG